MTERALLAISRVEAFKAWLTEHQINHRTSTADYQVMQVQLPGDSRWHAIYRRANATVHLSVPKTLVPLVRQFVVGGTPQEARPVTPEEKLKPTAEHASDDVPW